MSADPDKSSFDEMDKAIEEEEKTPENVPGEPGTCESKPELTKSQEDLVARVEAQSKLDSKAHRPDTLAQLIAVAQACVEDGAPRDDFHSNFGSGERGKKKIDKTRPSKKYLWDAFENALGKSKEKALEFIEETYNKNGIELHPVTKQMIENYLQDYSPNEDYGVPGFHAEVQAVNDLLNAMEPPEATMDDLKDINVATFMILRMKGVKGKTKAESLPGGRGHCERFAACPNCTGILHSHGVNVVTGITET